MDPGNRIRALPAGMLLKWLLQPLKESSRDYVHMDRSLKVKKKRFVRQSISRLPYPGKLHAFVLSEGFPSNSLRFHACSRTGSKAPPVGTTRNNTLSALQGAKGNVIRED